MWLHVPNLSTSLAFAAVPGDLIWDSSLPFASGPELCVTSSGKPTLRPSSWRGWRTRPWIRRLSGTISRPSTATRGVESWISSLRATRASLGPSPESGQDTTTSATSGPTSPASSERSSPSGSSSRTYPAICDAVSLVQLGTWDTWVTELRRASTRRRKSALPTSANASSLSPAWRTPAVGESGVTVERLDGELGTRLYDRETGRNAQYGLNQQVQMWPTPDADANATTHINMGGREGRVGKLRPVLAKAVQTWSTPRAGNRNDAGQQTRSGSRSGELLLPGQAIHWPTPLATDWKGVAQEGQRRGQLDAAAQPWPTPRASENENRTTRNAPSHGVTHGVTLAGAASSLPVPQTSTDGHVCSQKCRRLNQVFVEILMGWPLHWTCACSTTYGGD